MEKVWVIEDPDEYLQPQRTKKITIESPVPVEKNPALAFSLSILLWGGGQIYNDQKRKGLFFLSGMLMVCSVVILAIVVGTDFLLFVPDHYPLRADVFLLSELLFLCSLLFWQYNAGDAYHTAAKKRQDPFTGIQSRAYPFLCSLVIPGWGQFLNGQPIKGSIFTGFTILGIFSLASAPYIIWAWPALEPSEARFIIEGIFAFTVLFTPLIPLLWIFSSFDALKVSVDDLKKERYLDRIKYANNRRRTQGWVRGVFPQIKSTIFFLLLFLFLLIFTYYYYFPANYYREQLASLQPWLQKRGMIILPELISRLRTFLAWSAK